MIGTGPVEHQPLSDGRAAVWVQAPAMGLGHAVDEPAGEPVTVATGADGVTVLDNGLVGVTVEPDGTVSSYRVIRSDREVIAPGSRGALLQLHPDLPVEYDAWDIEEYYRRHVTDIDAVDRIEVTDRGPLVARVRVERSFRSSTVSQTYELRAGSSRLDVHLDIDWQERNHLLKLAWPVDVHANDVTRDIQYGHLKTPIHTNTTWDAARFEICAPTTGSTSGSPGSASPLLNDGRYGHDVTRTRGPDGEPTTTMRLTLLKGAIWPDPRADLGHHSVTCAVLPHAGRFRKEGVIAEGYRLNMPVRVVDRGRERARGLCVRDRRPPCGRGRGGQSRRGRLGRHHRAVLRVPRRTGGGHPRVRSVVLAVSPPRLLGSAHRLPRRGPTS